MIKGAGNDRGPGSRTKGEVAYRLEPAVGGEGTRVRLVVDYSLQGRLAQFSRTGFAQELDRRLIAEFAANLSAAWLGTRRLRQHPRRRSMSAHCYGWHFAVGFTRCSVDATIIGSNLSSKQTGFFGARRMGDLSEPPRATSAFGTSRTRPNVCDPDEKRTSTRRPGRPSLWRLITGALGMKTLLRWAADNNVSKAEAARRLIEYALEHRSRRTTR